MIPSYYQHFCPVKILSGNKAVSNIPFEMNAMGCKKAMIVTDKGVIDAGLINIVKEAFADSDRQIGYIFDETPPDSSNRMVNKLAKLFEKLSCDCFVAVGGGSALDTAKGANIVVSEGTDDILKLQGNEIIKKDLKPMIAVPTTSGTGSEVTKVAVIYNEEKNLKMSFVSDKLYPRIAVLDPRMTMTVPSKLTAATGMDALTHAIEAYTCIQKNPIDDIFARAAIELVRKYLVRATENGSDDEARLGMANASLFAGIAFSNSMVGMVHSLAHAAGGVCHLPHGIANAIFLPYGLEYNIAKVPQSIAEISGMLGGSIDYMEPEEQASVTVSMVKNLLKKLNRISGLPIRLKDAGVAEDKLPAIAKAAINDGSLVFNPVEMDYEEALSVLKRAY
ncbi:MAG: iron-containing alcohol dehydrogenase [Deltaproteobacteria bacterium]|nr:iron-containing alcohol dehydrogenase [Deltaproteobacteria bacterium]